MAMPSFDELRELLIPYGADFNPADVHGFLSGCQCGGLRLSDELLATALLDMLDLDVYGNGELLFALQRLNGEIGLALQSNDFEFAPLLDEEGEFAERLQQFSRWCEHFINGFGITSPDESTFGEDIQSALEDLVSFSRLMEETDLSDQDESALLELQEYCKVIALMLYTELVMVPLEQAQQKLSQVEQDIAPERRMPPSDERH